MHFENANVKSAVNKNSKNEKTPSFSRFFIVLYSFLIKLMVKIPTILSHFIPKEYLKGEFLCYFFIEFIRNISELLCFKAFPALLTLK